MWQHRNPEEMTFTERGRRAQILQGAIDTIVELGYPQASLARIAQRIGASKGAVLHYFPDKDNLVGALVLDVYRRGAEAIGAAVDAEPTVTGGLRAYIEANIAFIADHPRDTAALVELAASYRSPDGRRLAEVMAAREPDPGRTRRPRPHRPAHPRPAHRRIPRTRPRRHRDDHPRSHRRSLRTPGPRTRLRPPPLRHRTRPHHRPRHSRPGVDRRKRGLDPARTLIPIGACATTTHRALCAGPQLHQPIVNLADDVATALGELRAKAARDFSTGDDSIADLTEQFFVSGPTAYRIL